jgi:hypothetical protein
MTRCEFRPWRRGAGLGALLLAGALQAAAQAQDLRPFPASALRGELRITQPPEVLLNGKPARLSPGSRIRGADNMLALSGTLAGQALVVNYTLDPLGLVHDVWVLTATERARQPWPTTPAQAAAWRFDPGTQTWSKP